MYRVPVIWRPMETKMMCVVFWQVSLCSVQQAARVRGIWRGISLSPRLKFVLRAKKYDVWTHSFTLTSQLTDKQQVSSDCLELPRRLHARHDTWSKKSSWNTWPWSWSQYDPSIYVRTQRDILELNGQQYRCESFKYHIVLTSAAALTR